MKGLLVFVTLSFLGILFVNTYYHEETHNQIFIQDGCRNVKVSYGVVSHAVCLDSNYIESDNAMLAHDFNEIVSYNNSSIMMCFFFVVCFLLVWRRE